MRSRLIWRSAISTKMAEADWVVALEIFRASPPRRGDKGRNDRLFLEALHYFSVYNIAWRALPERFGKWNSAWRLSKSGVFETFFGPGPQPTIQNDAADLVIDRAAEVLAPGQADVKDSHIR